MTGGVVVSVVENFGAYYMEQKKREVISKKKVLNEEAKKENDASKTVSSTAVALKVPKCEIFDRSDFHDFYTLKVSMGGGGGGRLWR
jgi:hypothetical protein